MKIKLEEDLSREDIEVLIKYARWNQTVRRIATFIESVDKTVKCTSESSELWVNAGDIFYIESVDKRTFVYCRDSVYRSELRLYQLKEELGDAGFVQVSKACIINLNVLTGIRPLLNSRMEATLSNGEKINITRKYMAAIREKLQER
ncbi:LytTR family DNA-binding domain-containing protein [uncultured Robinsoniella sp.]|uniref:LytTR family DNA-binding domain-containing protein n=1 Tax=uncultured Robinsoniella sp. TaxID=904190 RepID=UPI00374FB6D4